MSDKCIHCGLDEDEHHTFAAPGRPSVACRCDAGTWGDPSKIPAVCSEFKGEGSQYCATCEHDKECHA